MLAHTQLSLLITQIRTGSVVPLARCARVSCLSDSALPAPPPPGPPLPGPPLEPTGAPAGLIDIGANLLDSMFQGEYRGKQAHPPDLQAVLERAAASGASGGRKQDRYGRPARRWLRTGRGALGARGRPELDLALAGRLTPAGRTGRRLWTAVSRTGVSDCIVTAGSLEEARAALALVRETRQSSSPVRLSCTVGVHPTRALEWLPAAARAAVEAAMAGVAAAEGRPPAAAAEAAATLDAAEADALASPSALTSTLTQSPEYHPTPNLNPPAG